MALRIKTTTGKAFRRCGLIFGGDWTEVEDETLEQRFASPSPIKKGNEERFPMIGDILLADPTLVCVPVTPAAAAQEGSDATEGTALSDVLSQGTIEILDKAEIRSVESLREWIAAGHSLEEIEGIGTGRAKAITEAMESLPA